ncbi:MAG: TrmH family RNA methyltransferase [Actinomycetota bacterium]
MRAARKLLKRAGRDRARACLVDSPMVAAEALRAGAGMRRLFVAQDDARWGELAAAAAARGVPVAIVPVRVIAALSDTTTPQGVVAVVEDPSRPLSLATAGASLVVVLADVRDPGNAGTLLRSASAAGADAVVFARGAVDPFHPKTLRAAAGATWHVPVVRDVEPRACLADLRLQGLSIIGSDAGAPSPLDEADLTGPIALVLGNEAHGLPAAGPEMFDEVLSIPMPGHAESLNVASAGSIILFEAVRQRRAAARSPS